MADPNQIIPDLEEITVTAFRDDFYDINNFMNLNLLRSCKFAIRIDRHPNILDNYRSNDLRQFTLLCDSIEFPGRSILTTDFNIPGRQKIRTPYKREFNEVTLSFYHSTKFPIYQYFMNWEDGISEDSSRTSYFSDIVTNISLFQFYDTTSALSLFGLGGNGGHVKYPEMRVRLINSYPVSVASVPSTWADDGFHKITATFFYEEAEGSVVTQPLKNLNVFDSAENRNFAITSIDQLLDNPARNA